MSNTNQSQVVFNWQKDTEIALELREKLKEHDKAVAERIAMFVAMLTPEQCSGPKFIEFIKTNVTGQKNRRYLGNKAVIPFFCKHHGRTTILPESWVIDKRLELRLKGFSKEEANEIALEMAAKEKNKLIAKYTEGINNWLD